MAVSDKKIFEENSDSEVKCRPSASLARADPDEQHNLTKPHRLIFHLDLVQIGLAVSEKTFSGLVN